jgi:hypothetical protein
MRHLTYRLSIIFITERIIFLVQNLKKCISGPLGNFKQASQQKRMALAGCFLEI